MDVKPSLRGVIHMIAFFVSLVAGPILVGVAQVARIGTAIYTAALAGLLGVSALYHRPNWRPAVRKWLAKLDHGMIFVLIAGTATPFALVIGNRWGKIVLTVVWSAALLGWIVQFVPVSVPKSVSIVPYLAIGWVGLSLMPNLLQQLGVAVPALLLGGGILYTLGAIAYARRSPNPVPGTFGYHEVFHSLVVAAAGFHYTAVALAVA